MRKPFDFNERYRHGAAADDKLIPPGETPLTRRITRFTIGVGLRELTA